MLASFADRAAAAAAAADSGSSSAPNIRPTADGAAAGAGAAAAALGAAAAAPPGSPVLTPPAAAASSPPHRRRRSGAGDRAAARRLRQRPRAHRRRLRRRRRPSTPPASSAGAPLDSLPPPPPRWRAGHGLRARRRARRGSAALAALGKIAAGRPGGRSRAGRLMVVAAAVVVGAGRSRGEGSGSASGGAAARAGRARPSHAAALRARASRTARTRWERSAEPAPARRTDPKVPDIPSTYAKDVVEDRRRARGARGAREAELYHVDNARPHLQGACAALGGGDATLQTSSAARASPSRCGASTTKTSRLHRARPRARPRWRRARRPASSRQRRLCRPVWLRRHLGRTLRDAPSCDNPRASPPRVTRPSSCVHARPGSPSRARAALLMAGSDVSDGGQDARVAGGPVVHWPAAWVRSWRRTFRDLR